MSTQSNSDHDLLIRVDSKVADMAVSLVEIQSSIKGLPGIFASREELKAVATETERRLNELEGKRNLWRYLDPIISAVVASTLTFLVVFYFQHVK